MSGRIPWVFYDPVLDETLNMEVNPNSGASPDFKKNTTKKVATAPGAPTLVFQGNDEPTTFSFSGVILLEAHYNFLYNAWAKSYPIQITDDLGRTWTIYLETFSPKRKLSRIYPWKHEYSCEGVLVG